MPFDTSFDFRTDTPGYPKNDPDTRSPTLHRYHRLLWSKALPGGARFDLAEMRNASGKLYLRHHSGLVLSSDSIIPTFTRWGFAKDHPSIFSRDENEAFMSKAYTIGGMIVFPAIPVDGKWTINQARGCHGKISDRMDLTLECVRRFYLDQDSPIATTLGRYRDFFRLFEDFRGYVDFFLLQDLVTADDYSVKFFMPFNDFTGFAVLGGRVKTGNLSTPQNRQITAGGPRLVSSTL